MKVSRGPALAYVYFEDELGQRTAANLLRRNEARRTAVQHPDAARAAKAAAVLVLLRAPPPHKPIDNASNDDNGEHWESGAG